MGSWVSSPTHEFLSFLMAEHVTIRSTRDGHDHKETSKNPDSPEDNSKADDREENIEVDRSRFKSYMHVFFDGCARNEGNRDFAEYRDIHESRCLADVSTDRLNACDIDPWWEFGNKGGLIVTYKDQ